MLEWLRSGPRRNLVLALAVAGCFAILAASVTLAIGRSAHAKVGHNHVHFSTHGSGHDSGVQEVAYDQTFDVSSGGLLRVEVADLDVGISTGPGSQARVILRIEGDGSSAQEAFERIGFSVEESSAGLEIRTDPQEDWHTWADHDDHHMSLDITVPRRFDVSVRTGDGDVALESIQGSVDLQTGDGDIALESIDGSVTLQTGDGDIVLEGAVSSDIRIQTGDGDVVAGALDADRVQVRTGDGDIMLEDLAGSLTASTGDGDVMVSVREFDGIQIQTGDGDVTVSASPSIAALLDIVGGEFSIDSAFGLAAMGDDRHFQGELNGGGPALTVRTGDGEIRLIEH